MKTSLKMSFLKRFLPYFVYLASLSLLNVGKLYWIGVELLIKTFYIFSISEKEVPFRVLTSSLLRFPLFQRQVNGQAFTLRQPQVFEKKHLQILQFYLRSLTIFLLVLWSSIVVTQLNLQLVLGGHLYACWLCYFICVFQNERLNRFL